MPADTDSGELLRAGGWGYLFGDDGSGFAIGSAALRMITKAYDGRSEPTILTNLVLDQYGLEHPQELIKHIYRAESPSSAIAALSDLVEQAAIQNDLVAISILNEAALELACTLQIVYRKLGSTPVPLALTGGVILHSKQFATKFYKACQHLGLEFSAVNPISEAAEGAVRLAQELLLEECI